MEFFIIFAIIFTVDAVEIPEYVDFNFENQDARRAVANNNRETIDPNKHLYDSMFDKEEPASLSSIRGRADDKVLSFACDFNSTINSTTHTICMWNLNDGQKFFGKTNWQPGNASEAYFVGGPTVDGNDNPEGGYAVFDVAYSRWSEPSARNGWLVSETIPATDPNGLCLAFQYSLNGLGIDSLAIIMLYDVDLNSTETALGEMINGVNNFQYATIWARNDSTKGQWRKGHLSLDSQTDFQIVFVAVPSMVWDKYEGYAAIDNTVFTYGPCPGDCNFESNTCNWEDVEVGSLDQFQWSLARGTVSTVTGPLRDWQSSTSTRLPGGYTYINSEFPRRPGDKASLASPVFPKELVNPEPYCLVFWMNAYGYKIGGLSVTLIPDPNCTTCTQTTIWNLRPEKMGSLPDTWIRSQAVLVSPADFRILITGSVGEVGESDIAIDNISLQPGICPAMPSFAAPPGDCTFDDDSCGWIVKSIHQSPQSPPLWDLALGENILGCPLGHSPVPLHKTDSYMKFQTDNFQHTPLDRAWLLSPLLTIDPQTTRYCLTFWINMYAPVPHQNGLGAVRVLIVDSRTLHDPNPRFQAVWRLTNSQSPKWIYAEVAVQLKNGTHIAFEGIEGVKTLGTIAIDDVSLFPIYNNQKICRITPFSAQLQNGDCHFDTDNLCGWETDGGLPGSPVWILATSWDSPNFINDHTFGAPRVGFVFYNPAGQNTKQHAMLQSPEIMVQNGTIGACFSFWYLAYGNDPDAVLTVGDRLNGALGSSDLLRLRLNDYAGTDLNPSQWNYGQVMVGQNVTTFRVTIYATGTYGIFAVDDVKISPTNTTCATIPPPISQHR
ncbi:hypothetical protein CHUAL_010555 [Chamberlinius hualienensis]